MGSYQIIAFVLLVAVAVRKGLALECVQCNSFSTKDCDSNIEKYKLPCTEKFANATSCRKMEQEVYYDGDYHTRTIRQCALTDAPARCIERTGTYRVKIFYCHCKEDNCNGAGAVSISLGLSALAAVVSFLFKS
ncbi:hypothetical protein C0Q70_02010 [Pomacea canaliculata]|uniref:Protein quiver n=2 Tax=Pomacea canaliculata TaxID=400727 RepID=A0A2T7Q162_POMCA|nr:hypothetical protein C0Q70_02010 [Pomacea canaliculata]